MNTGSVYIGKKEISCFLKKPFRFYRYLQVVS